MICQAECCLVQLLHAEVLPGRGLQILAPLAGLVGRRAWLGCSSAAAFDIMQAIKGGIFSASPQRPP